VQNGGGGRDGVCWCGSGDVVRGIAELEVCVQRNGGECSRACGGCSGRSLRARVWEAGVPSRQGSKENPSDPALCVLSLRVSAAKE
jgi:hypothetical protein